MIFLLEVSSTSKYIKSVFFPVLISLASELNVFFTPFISQSFPTDLGGNCSKILFQAPNGYVLNKKERDAIVDDAFAYGIKNWADTFDETIESLPPKPTKETNSENSNDEDKGN